MTSSWEIARRERLEALRPLVLRLEGLLFRHDPIGIADDEAGNLDEYRSEAESIALRLGSVRSEAEVLHLVHQEFGRWFDARIAGPPSRYAALASEVWAGLGVDLRTGFPVIDIGRTVTQEEVDEALDEE